MEQVSKLCQRLPKAEKLAKLQVSQEKMKTWYDQRVQKRTFKPGGKVLILLPVQGQPLQAKYGGPFTIEKENTFSRCKAKCLCHINMLKKGSQMRPGKLIKPCVPLQ